MALFVDTKTAFEAKSNKELKKEKRLFQFIVSTFLKRLVAIFFKLPIATNLTLVKPIIRNTIYKHFVSGETPEECLKVANELYRYGISSIMDYSVEGQESEEEFDH